ncbi:MAG TPA: DUF4126 family protein [Longimicrobiales bacterium]|nr:DUF4126 family protein [Longimicrobiales bacterium]
MRRNGTHWGRSLLAGALSGLRSASGPALAAWQLHDQRTSRRDRLPRRLLGSEHAREITGAMAAGELLADKHPDMPSRLEAPALIGRAVAGAVAAAALVPRRASTQVVVGHALIGAGAAMLSTYLSYHLRRSAVQGTHAPDRVIALIEDALTYVGGGIMMKKM